MRTKCTSQVVQMKQGHHGQCQCTFSRNMLAARPCISTDIQSLLLLCTHFMICISQHRHKQPANATPDDEARTSRTQAHAAAQRAECSTGQVHQAGEAGAASLGQPSLRAAPCPSCQFPAPPLPTHSLPSMCPSCAKIHGVRRQRVRPQLLCGPLMLL